MAELDSPIKTPVSSLATPSPKAHQNTWFLCSFLYKAIFFLVLIAILPLFPSQAPEFLNQSILTGTWELIHLLFVGIAISYGLFSRRNADPDVEKETPWKADTPQSYVARILQVSSVFDDDEADKQSGSFEDSKTQAWSSQYYRNEPVVMVADGTTEGGDKGNKSLSLPVRRFKSPSQGHELLNSHGETDDYIELSTGFNDEFKETVVLRSPIPWRSRSGRMEVKEELRNGKVSPPPHSLPPSVMDANNDPSSWRTSSFRSPVTPSASTTSSPKNLSRSNSPSPELRAKSGEDFVRKKTLYKATAPPPAPPRLPPPFVHGSLAFSEKMNKEKSFKEELKDYSRKGKEELLRGNDTSMNSLRSETNLRNQNGGSLLGRSVRTVRSKEVQNGLFEEATKVSSDSSLERMRRETHQLPPLPRSQSERKNGYQEKVIIASDDSESDDVGETTDVEDVKNSGVDAGPDQNEVDKKADEFIAKFREQIRLQRIESIKRSTGRRTVRSPT